MKRIQGIINKHRLHYEALPFFQFLGDDTLPAEKRLAFYPGMAHFIMSFGDLNNAVLRELPTDDPYQKMVNAHTYEDEHHWPWYLEDFKKLGFDGMMAPTELLRFLFSDTTRTNRVLTYELVALISSASSLERLVIIEAIEETGNVLFGLMTQLARHIEKKSGQTLRYCGDFHFDLESGHAMNSEEGSINKIVLDAAAYARGIELVERVFELFTDWSDELLAFAREGDPRFPRRVWVAPLKGQDRKKQADRADA